MNKGQVIAKLREQEPEWKAANCSSVGVRVLRPMSISWRISTTRSYTLLTMGRIESRLADLLGTRVDLSAPEWLREAIEMINLFIGGMELSAYQADEKTKAAVERKVQILTEAIIRLDDESPGEHPEIDKKGYRDMGNSLRHPTKASNDELVWSMVKDDLPALKDLAQTTGNHPRVSHISSRS